MQTVNKEFQIFVKPAGARCNLSCSYCYYLDKQALYPEENKFLMSDEVLEEYIKQQIAASGEDVISFSWHGGEPLLAGIDFYRKALKLQDYYKPNGSVILNGIQTNGTLLNEDWCKFLSDNDFIVGISIDGTAELHGKFRKTKSDDNSFSSVMKGFNLLKDYGLIPEILCVVNAENVNSPKLMYDFFKTLGAKFITFLPLVVQDNESPDGVNSKTVPAEGFGKFLSDVFDEWVEKDIGEIKIQIFEEAARTAFNQEHTLCIFKKNCGGVPVIEHNGDFYSCDHYVNRENYLGNISDHSVSWFLDSKKQKEFGLAKSQTLPQYCLNCDVLPMCNGECPKNRFIDSPDGEPGLNYLCAGYKLFFSHCKPFVDAISETWKNQ
jgi:uncharacterized protein